MVVKKNIKIGMLGLGIVGCGVAEILSRNRQSIKEKTGTEISLTKVLVRDVHKPRSVDLAGIELTTDPAAVLSDPEIDVVVEVIGGVEES